MDLEVYRREHEAVNRLRQWVRWFESVSGEVPVSMPDEQLVKLKDDVKLIVGDGR